MVVKMTRASAGMEEQRHAGDSANADMSSWYMGGGEREREGGGSEGRERESVSERE